MSFIWDEQAMAALREGWAAGLKVEQIADKLGRVSRNAVIGKARRLGLQQHAGAKGRRTSVENANVNRRRNIRMQKLRMGAASPKTLKSVAAAGGREQWLAKQIKKPIPARPVHEAKPRTDLPTPVARVSFADLESDHCRYPVGEPGHPGFGFCGEPRLPGKSYCACCMQRVMRTS